MRRKLSAVALAGAFVFAGSSAAFAAETTGYPSVGPGCEVGSGTVKPGEEIDVDCSGFEPIVTVNVTVSCVAEGAAAASARVVVTTTTTTTSKGTMTWTGSVTEEGTCTINASTGGGSGSARVAVKAPRTVTTASMNNLARTGTDSSTLLWGAGGLGAIALGTAGMVVSRKRTNDAR